MRTKNGKAKVSRSMRKSIFVIVSLPVIFPFLAVSPCLSANIVGFSLSPSTINFPDLDPDVYPSVSSSTNLIVTIKVRQLQSAENWLLEIFLNEDFTNGVSTIPVSWTATGTGAPPGTFRNGTLTRGIYYEVGRGPGDPQNKQADVVCTMGFSLPNSWSYSTGSYQATVTLRLTAPGDSRSLTFTFSLVLSGRAKLQMAPLSLSFPDAEPDSVPSIPANMNPLSFTSSSRTGSGLTTTLSCLASSDLASGASTIPISRVTWQSTGSGYVSGTMSKTTAQPAGSWTGSGVRSGNTNYFLANSWSYNVGNYSATVTYTLTAP